MLSWSSTENGETVDLAEVAAGGAGSGIADGSVLLGFATACAETDDDALGLARDRLAEVRGEAFMIDAAAVAANFEMMTRLSDSTGATMPAAGVEAMASTIGVMGIAEVTSRR